MSDHVRLGRGVEVPTLTAGPAVQVMVFTGLVSISEEEVGLVAGTFLFCLDELWRGLFLLGATGDGILWDLLVSSGMSSITCAPAGMSSGVGEYSGVGDPH
jgi:hypothetical protein